MRKYWIIGIAAAMGIGATLWTTYLHAQAQRPAESPLLLHAVAPVGANPGFVFILDPEKRRLRSCRNASGDGKPMCSPWTDLNS